MNSNLLRIAVALSLLGSAAASAQSLGDIARQEEARRKSVRTPGKVYTNDSLRTEPAPAVPPPSSVAQPPSADNPSSTSAPDPAAGVKKDETYWKKRMQDAREALERSKSFAEALQSRINALTTDFAARSDPAQRAQIGNDRQKALAELDRVKKDIEASTKAIAELQEEARKAGVPAGWVR